VIAVAVLMRAANGPSSGSTAQGIG